MDKVASLPVPPDAALRQSARLTALLRDEIAAAGGWIAFDRYMELALYAPGLGYYSGGAQKFGAAGDFTTAPELTPYFGRTLAGQIAELFDASAAGGCRLDAVLEFGAGTGKLAADIVLALDALDAGCRSYGIVELSGELRQRQRETIARRCAEAGKPGLAAQVVWHDRLPESFDGAIVGNEVLDAMPVRLFVRSEQGWLERGVVAAGDGLGWRDRSVDGPLPAALAALPDAVLATPGYVAETHQAALGFIRTIAQLLRRGAVLLADYGFPAAEYYHPQRTGGTLIGHYRHHSHDDPFLYPGLSDITAHVEFSGVAHAGVDAGLELLGYTSQGRFLLNAGIVELLRECDPQQVRSYAPAVSAVQKLLSEAEMGELFKVIGFSRGVDWLPSGFASGDRSHTL